ncbi:hypothetical protein [Pseudomonas sp. FP2338]|uniref:hypothetical protein n=1 Tax=Pseudomonas sp. FP2338 TaxID=2954093 RepID=UPI002732BD2D|nr:hypothetical protein [Pseudomonas sp. FP2338]WLH85151.1 hypothetical protein PSH96_01545 [Pseudomonas sp. FP2338]
MFIQGGLDHCQSLQHNHNFKLPFVVSIIQNGIPISWLSVGLIRTIDCVERYGAKPDYSIALERVSAAEGLLGRLYLNSSYTKRNPYSYGETLVGDLAVFA